METVTPYQMRDEKQREGENTCQPNMASDTSASAIDNDTDSPDTPAISHYTTMCAHSHARAHTH